MRKPIFMILALTLSADLIAEVSKWVDENGKVHYGDIVPEKYTGTAKRLPIRSDEPSEAQIREAQARVAKLKSAATTPPPPSSPSAPPPSVAPQSAMSPDSASLSCEEQWNQYEESYACFDTYRIGKGIVRPEAFQHCKQVKPPDHCKDTRKIKWN